MCKSFPGRPWPKSSRSKREWDGASGGFLHSTTISTLTIRSACDCRARCAPTGWRRHVTGRHVYNWGSGTSQVTSRCVLDRSRLERFLRFSFHGCKSQNETGGGVQLFWWLLAFCVFCSSRLRGAHELPSCLKQRLSIGQDNSTAPTSFIWGFTACHPERSEESGSPDEEILRYAQDDRRDTAHVRSREALPPHV